MDDEQLHDDTWLAQYLNKLRKKDGAGVADAWRWAAVLLRRQPGPI